MGSIITTIGLQKIAQATAQNPLKLNAFAVGDGDGVTITPNENMTSLVNEKYRNLINDKYNNNNNAIFECVISTNAPIVEGFYVREIGLFDEDGDLIVIANVPQQYRPATQEGNIVTELLFNVSIVVQNSDVIEININEQLFATQDALNRLIEEVEKIKEDKKALIESSIGIEKWFNTDNRYKDKNIIRVGIKTYALMDENNILSIADYPLLFNNCGAIDRGDGTFAVANFFDGTIRHLPRGSSRNLGSYEEDAFKVHNHNATTNLDVKLVGGGIFRLTANGTNGSVTLHNFVAPDNNGERALYGEGRPGDPVYNPVPSRIHITDVPDQRGDNQYHKIGFDFSKIKTNTSTATTSIADTGGEETRMKNTAGQWYILAKIDI